MEKALVHEQKPKSVKISPQAKATYRPRVLQKLNEKKKLWKKFEISSRWFMTLKERSHHLDISVQDVGGSADVGAICQNS